MKLKNVVAGMFIEAKRKTFGLSHEVIHKGTRVQVTDNDGSTAYGVRVVHEDIEDGYAWVDPADFRKVKEVAVEEVTEARTEHSYSVGDEVLVGSEGAGYGYVDRDLANKVCTVTAVFEDGCLRIAYPSVTSTHGYLTYPHYVRPYVAPAPVEEAPTELHNFREGDVSVKDFGAIGDKLHDFRTGDVLLCITACEGKHDEQCIAGRLYAYERDSSVYLHRVCVADPELYLEQATVLPENFTLYARKVEDNADTST